MKFNIEPLQKQDQSSIAGVSLFIGSAALGYAIGSDI